MIKIIDLESQLLKVWENEDPQMRLPYFQGIHSQLDFIEYDDLILFNQKENTL